MSGAITFPPNPTVGQIFTSGGTTWQWNGTAWVNANTGTNFLPLTGGSMTGAIQLPGNAATALQATPLQQVNAVVAPAFNAVGRSFVQNGLFNIQQRGAGPWNAGTPVYTADRWMAANSVDAFSFTVVTLADADRTAIGDEAAQYALQNVFTGSVTANAYVQVRQPIENVRRLSGKACIASFYARATSGTPRLGLSYGQIFGGGGSPSAPVYASIGATPNLSTTWTRYSLPVTFPSSAGKTFGTTAGSDYTLLTFTYSDVSNQSGTGVGQQSGTVQLWGVQLEIGSVMTPLDYGGSPRQQLAQCQRFFIATGYPYLWGFNSWAANSYQILAVWFPVTMRGTPTVVMGAASGNTNVTTLDIFNANMHGIEFRAVATAAGGAGITMTGYNASADL